MTTTFDFVATRLDGRDEPLGRYAGHVLLVVNTASRCGFTPQYAGLERLQRAHGARGFTVLGFPCNQFGRQEPGDAAAIGGFCQANYGVSFPMFAKVAVNGAGDAPALRLPQGVPPRAARLGRHQVELHQVPGGPHGRGRGALRAADQAGRADRGDRTGAVSATGGGATGGAATGGGAAARRRSRPLPRSAGGAKGGGSRPPRSPPMPHRLDSTSLDFATAFQALLATKREVSEDVDAAVRAILRDVREEGDAALVRYSERFDRVDLAGLGLRVTPDEIAAAVTASREEDLAALRLAHERIRSFHERQLPADLRFTDPLGVDLGWRWTAIQAVGLYVPGGTASYPSSVLMNAVPAKVAGCERLVMVVPAPEGRINPLVLAAADLAGVDEVYRVGGAQAIAALAYGTRTIAPVMKIMGPGNAYVACAKRQVFGHVGIDMIAGPSEVLIIADATGDAEWIAADLLAQAEHDAAAQSILVTDDPALADAVEREVEAQLRTLRREAIARASWRDFGAIILVPRLADAVPLADRLAPEHLEIIAADAEGLSTRSATPGRSSSVPTPPRRSATTSAVPTTCCPQPARPASRPA